MTCATYFDAILRVVRAWDHLGSRVLPNGTELIGQVPHIAPEAWLHQIYAPITAAQREMIKSLPVPVHGDYDAFLDCANGMNLFSGRLCIYGVRLSYGRKGDERWQPFDLRIPNTIERIRGAPSDALYVGVDTENERTFAILSNTGEVVRSPLREPRVSQRWSSLSEMLVAEVERLSALCDSYGRITDQGSTS